MRALLPDLNAQWLLELSPATSPSPEVPLDRSRLLFDAEGCCWPFRSRLDAWPLDSESVPAVLLRHAWQPGLAADPLDESLRVLRPGGLLLSMTANPWHPAAWRELGRQTMWLPSWPQFQLLHARRHLELNVPASAFWRGLVPGLSPVLLLVARKPTRAAPVSRLRVARPRLVTGSAVASQCRAA